MTAKDWELCEDPREMLRAAQEHADPLEFWLVVCALGRRLWGHFRRSQQLQKAIETTELWLAGHESEEELSFWWFTAVGLGAGAESGWAIADHLLDTYGKDDLVRQDASSIIWQLLDNPFRAKG